MLYAKARLIRIGTELGKDSRLRYLLNLVYATLLTLLSPWLLYRAVFQKKNRRGWWIKLTGRVPSRKSVSPCIWLHAVSVGEVNLLRPIMSELSNRFPGCEFAISTTTETGYDLARKLYPRDQVFFCPFDFTWAIRNVIRNIRPSLLVLAELELWPNLISVSQGCGVPVALVNGRISARSFENYLRFKWFWSPVLRKVTASGVQNEEYGRRMEALGVDPQAIQITGSVKFDGANTDRGNAQTQQLRKLVGLQPDDFVFLAGSTQVEEDLMAAEALLRLRESEREIRLVLVPRHIHRSQKLKKILTDRGLSVQLRSELGKQKNQDVFATADVLVVDVIGELSAWWGLASVAYVGGSMGKRGGQNMIETAAYGVPVCFGRQTRNFRDVVQLLLDQHAAQVVCSENDLGNFVQSAISQPQLAEQMGLRGQQLVIRQRGAVDRTVVMLEEILNRKKSTDLQRDTKRHAAA